MTDLFDPSQLNAQAQRVRRAARELARQPGALRDDALKHMAEALRAHAEAIL
ncbi:gamma-glutamyl-phosphate reductase, partial [Lujinxingia vulgaris]